jgi:hypothetical protein
LYISGNYCLCGAKRIGEADTNEQKFGANDKNVVFVVDEVGRNYIEVGSSGEQWIE